MLGWAVPGYTHLFPPWQLCALTGLGLDEPWMHWLMQGWAVPGCTPLFPPWQLCALTGLGLDEPWMHWLMLGWAVAGCVPLFPPWHAACCFRRTKGEARCALMNVCCCCRLAVRGSHVCAHGCLPLLLLQAGSLGDILVFAVADILVFAVADILVFAVAGRHPRVCCCRHPRVCCCRRAPWGTSSCAMPGHGR